MPEKNELVTFFYNGDPMKGYIGAPIAAALKTAGIMVHSDWRTSLPVVNENVPCIGCGMGVISCSGQAISIVDEDEGNGIGNGDNAI